MVMKYESSPETFLGIDALVSALTVLNTCTLVNTAMERLIGAV